MKRIISILTITLLIVSCSNKKDDKEVKESGALFTKMPSSFTHVDFVNTIKEDSVINQFNFAYGYNGAGVAAGDLNNDGLDDLVFTSNMRKTKVYLNKGGLKFEDITDKSGILPTNWCTGVSMVDVDNDGDLDVCISRSGTHLKPEERTNLLYINQGDLTFKEESKKWGLDDFGLTTHTFFLDIDNDGDLDAYLLNARGEFYEEIDLPNPPTKMEDPYNVHRLYENKGDKFVDISRSSGIYHFGYGLGAIPVDFNKDGLMDLYVGNDYFMPDKLFINQGNNTFKNELEKYVKHTSLSTMGLDAADINNDGLVDIFTCEMMPSDLVRKAKLGGATPFDRYRLALKNGYGHQNVKNTMQLNNGDDCFSDIAYSANIAETDWSWTSLLADFDQDGYRDLYVCNGYYKEVTDQDFSAYSSYELSRKGVKPDFVKILKEAPSIKTPNYAFKNNGDLTFTRKYSEWGLGDLSFSNGAIYSDLDNDGDLEIIVSNINNEAFIYKNNANNKNFLKIKFDGQGGSNTYGMGCKVSIITDKGRFFADHTSYRGYEGSVSPILHFGLPNNTTIKEVYIKWPGGKGEVVKNAKVGSQIIVKYSNATSNFTNYEFAPDKATISFTEVKNIQHKHSEVIVSDFKREPMLQMKYSQLGPALAVADVNGDGLHDVMVSGAHKGSRTTLYIQNPNGMFSVSKSQPWSNIAPDITGLLFFDADGDGDNDVYVGPGGNEIATNDKSYLHKLYINDGKGNFKEDKKALSGVANSCATVSSADYDGDGDLDLFVAGRVTPNNYPIACRSYLLENNGGVFTDVTQEKLPALYNSSMVSSAVWADYNKDNKPDLIVTGEWMPLVVMENNGNGFTDKTKDLGLLGRIGWFNSVSAADYDGDGDLDFLLGNRGHATQFRATEKTPIKLYVNDFDRDGRVDPIYTMKYKNGKDLFLATATEFSLQMSTFFRKTFKRNAMFLNKSPMDVFGSNLVDGASILTANNFETFVYENKQNEPWVAHTLPKEVQVAAINGSGSGDLTGNGLIDILLVGNNYGTKTEHGPDDAFNGGFLKNLGGFKFKFYGRNQTGFLVDRDARSFAFIKIKGEAHALIGNNNSALQLYAIKGLNISAFSKSLNTTIYNGSGYLSQSGKF